jgi:hypothetical protein
MKNYQSRRLCYQPKPFHYLFERYKRPPHLCVQFVKIMNSSFSHLQKFIPFFLLSTLIKKFQNLSWLFSLILRLYILKFASLKLNASSYCFTRVSTFRIRILTAWRHIVDMIVHINVMTSLCYLISYWVHTMTSQLVVMASEIMNSFKK